MIKLDFLLFEFMLLALLVQSISWYKKCHNIVNVYINLWIHKWNLLLSVTGDADWSADAAVVVVVVSYSSWAISYDTGTKQLIESGLQSFTSKHTLWSR